MAEVNENQGGEVNDGDLKENRIDEDGEEKKKRKYKTTPRGRRDLSRAEDMNVCLKYCTARVYHQGNDVRIYVTQHLDLSGVMCNT